MSKYTVECYIYDKETNTETNILEYFKTKEDMRKWAREKEEEVLLELHNVITKIQ